MASCIMQLSDEIISQIAAGEVVESSASVVKELVENAVDARARNIAIAVKGAGMGLIRVADDGMGIAREDLLLAVSRHATSKLKNFADLEKILTLGFRGEALSSIASVCKIKILSAKTEKAYLLKAEGGKNPSIEPAARMRGTTIEAASLFYNVPVRKKFQKSGAFLNSKILRTVYSLALAHPQISFSLTIDEKQVFKTGSKGLDFEQAFKNTAAKVLGSCAGYRWINVREDEENFQLLGYISDPEASKKNKSRQKLIVNGRPIVSSLISEAVKEGYATAISEDSFPAFVLHLKIDPALIDVNVHPQKKEIRFKEGFFLKEKIKKAVFSLFYAGHVSGQEKSREMAEFFQAISVFSDREKKPPAQNEEKKAFFVQADKEEESFPEPEKKAEQLLFPEKEKKYTAYAMVGFYYFMQAWPFQRTGVAIVDLKKVLSSVLFNKALEENKTGAGLQKLLIPKLIELPLEEMKAWETNRENLCTLGLETRKVGPKTVALDSAVSFVEEERLEEFFFKIFSELKIFGKQRVDQDFKKQSLARSLHFFAQRREKTFSFLEADALMQNFFRFGLGPVSPVGGKIAVFLDKKAIDRLF